MDNLLPLKPSAKVPYPYQQADIDLIFDKISGEQNYRLLYQLPTGGGKTVVFSEIVKKFLDKSGQKALVLTHRVELCKQTSTTLLNAGIATKMITSSIKVLDSDNPYQCYVAMVETLKNRMREKKFPIDDIGLVIIDEAHHNSFGKLLSKFKNASVIGVTATPLSSDARLPMKKSYKELITGESIPSLIEKGFLAKGTTYAYDVELNSLKTGITGDFTVKSSDELYAGQNMLDLLMQAYESKAKGKKTLIFNNGIISSLRVYETFKAAGLPIRHLDNKTPLAERSEILKWFKKTKGSILTSVSILTTGFDEPSVQAIILNRATKSLTLYYQMIGRGSRRMNGKKFFNIIDLGNNAARFGTWDRVVDWQDVFQHPDRYLDSYSEADTSSEATYVMSPAMRAIFSKSSDVAFDVEESFQRVEAKGDKHKEVIWESIRQHAFMCIENSSSISEALELAKQLQPDIDFRVKYYTQRLEKTTKSYKEWLTDDYKQRLNTLIAKIFHKFQPEESKELVKL
ncbi:MAG TPA: DEAD/DEAH box helicase [Flavobacterium sp.]|jgi:superfamily II DNA or RNA helicase